MSPANHLNQILRREYPAAERLLTDFGKRLYFPKGVPAQAAEAKNCTFNATIGQLKDDNGHPLPLPAMAQKFQNLPRDAYLVENEAGLWTHSGLSSRQRSEAGSQKCCRSRATTGAKRAAAPKEATE